MATIAQELMDKGIEQGIERGIKKGREEGQHQKQVEIAQRLLALHTVVTVSEITGLSVEEVVQIQRDLAAENDTNSE